MRYHIELWKDGKWCRLCSNLASMDVALNLKRDWARRNRIEPDNYSILIEVL